MDRIARPLAVVVVVVLFVNLALAAPATSLGAEGTVDYLKQIKPLLAERCFACHGALKQAGGLRLDTAAAIRKGGDSGAAVDVKHVSASVLLARITAASIDERMPPEGEGAALKPEEVERLQAWIAAGAAGPTDEHPESDPRSHWSFRPPVRPPVPQVKNSAWVRNPIDAFLAAEHERRGVQPQPEADPALLCRRLYLDLTGLPPTREQLAEFVRSYSITPSLQHSAAKVTESGSARVMEKEKAYLALVDRLLASPQYGERWGRHWMDIWRYSDWWGLGEDIRNSQKHIWHWRDWIVESLNADVGYDEMIRQMLAADELYPDDLDKLRATGYLVRSYFRFNRQSWLDEVVTHTSKGLLGLTLNCAKCHDHKYDPFAQTDYYKLRAFFEPYQVRTDLVPGEADLTKDGIPRVFDCDLDAPTYRFIRGDEFKPVKDEPLAPGFPELLLSVNLKIEPVKLPPTAYQPGLRPWVFDNQLKLAEERIATAREELAKAQQALVDGRRKLAVAHFLGKRPAAATPPAPIAANDAKSSAAAAPTAAPLPSYAELQAARVAAEKALAAAELELPALRARGDADRARTSGKDDAAKEAAIAAYAAEKRSALAAAVAALAKRELELVRAPTDKRIGPQKRVDEARADVTKAEAVVAAIDKDPRKRADYTPLRGAQKAPASSTETADERDRPFPKTSTGRRTALAKLLTDRQNPLVARVAVNHIWMRHLGKPLVPTVFEFGRKGLPPTHPELLDWLAVEFMEGSGDRGQGSVSDSASSALAPRPSPLTPAPWSMKHLHRLIVTSSAYRMSSSTADNATAAKADPDNVSYWHRTPIRLEAQVVRDSLLHLAGELDLTMGGPTLNPVAQQFTKRRSIYFTHSHNEHHRFLAMFDDADVLECYRRDQSIVPQQALALANGKQSLEAAAAIAAHLNQLPETKPDDEFIRQAFTTVLCCAPTSDEVAACREALVEWRKLPPFEKGTDVAQRARINLVHALLNHNDFVTLK
jgi:hypothetical protein